MSQDEGHEGGGDGPRSVPDDDTPLGGWCSCLLGPLVVIGVIAAIVTPNMGRARSSAREKACYANLRVIASALEMYAMDKPPGIDFRLPRIPYAVLQQGQHLRSQPRCPEQPGQDVYRLETAAPPARSPGLNEDLSVRGSDPTGIATEGVVVCTVHGTVD